MTDRKFRFLFSGCAFPAVTLVQFTKTVNTVEVIIGGGVEILTLAHLPGERDLFCLEIEWEGDPLYILGEVMLHEINYYADEAQAHFNGIFMDTMTKAEFEIWSEQMNVSEWEVCEPK